MNWLIADDFIKNALKEDIPYGDVTTEAIVQKNTKSQVDLIVKEDGVIAGLCVFERVFKIIGGAEVKFTIKEGEEVKKGQVIGTVIGDTKKVLIGERVALNYLQRMSGIATLTRKFVKELETTKVKLLDTRKTTPNMRIFEKYAVKVGGGSNHRFNLSDGVLIKDNHIDAAGGIKNAIELVRKNAPFVRKIEVEVENFDQLKEALDGKADIIMLDNMDVKSMRKAVNIIDGRAITEASGNITLENIRSKGESGVDYISTGALTHSFKILDLSMKNLRNIG